MHEIGHAVLGHSEETDPEVAEAEAAFFAKYAIAPPPLVHKIQPECPEEIADIFCISYEASWYALEYYHKWLYMGNDYVCKQSFLNGIHELARQKYPEKLIVYGRFPKKWTERFPMPITVCRSFSEERWDV